MKTKLVSRKAFNNALLILLLFGMSFEVSAQCPTVTNANPTICIGGGGFDFNDLNSYATDTGDGIVWYDAPSGGSVFMPNELVTETTYYADNDSGTCVTRSPITVNFTVNSSGQNLDRIYCSNENATVQTYIDDVLQFSRPPSGSVDVYNDYELTDEANPLDAIPTGGSTYFIVFVDSGGCESQLEIGKVGVFSAPADPTPSVLQDFCADSNPTVADLNPGTASTSFNWYAGLDGMGDPIQPALSLLESLIDGNTYYIQVEDIFCDSNPIAVTVNIEIPVESGTPASFEYCDDSLPSADFHLFDELGGPKDATGSWSGPIATSNGHLGTVNISTLTTAGTYTFTYLVPGIGACPDETTSVLFTVYETLSSGDVSPASPASFCEAGLPSSFDLFTLLENHDLGGQWTQGTTSSGTVVTSSIDLTSFTSATYSYTYTQNILPNPCPEESTTVQVTVLADPNAGIAINQTFCENDLISNSPFDLFDALDGSQDNDSGVWTNSADATIANTLDITGLTVIGSPYIFNYTIDNGTCSDTEQISITIEPAPESGTAISPEEFCEGSAPASYNLFDLLTGADLTGTWYSGTDNLGTPITNPTDLSLLTPSTYSFTYEVDAIGSCEDELVTVSVIINPLPNTGIPTSEMYCENDLAANSPLDLFGQLSGEDSGGTWTDDNTSGALTASDVDLTLLTVGSYNFTYTIADSNNCENSSTVNITVEDAPESGTAISPEEFCEGSAPASYNLFDLLTGADLTGTWYSGTDNLGTPITNPTDLSLLTPSTYSFTYEVDAIGSCEDELVTVSVIINPLPNTGIPTSEMYCENDLAANSPLDLFGQLSGEDSGGTWTDDNTSGALTASDVDLTLLTVGSYNFTYTITDSNNCENSSTVNITVEDAPESGTANSPEEFCEGSAPASYNLFDLLTGADLTGTWFSGINNLGTPITNPTDLSVLIPGTYSFTYEVDAIGSCEDELVTVSVIINPLPNTGIPTSEMYCENDLAANSPLDLFGQLSGEDSGGTWTDDNTSGALTASDVDLTLLTVGSYNFTYTIADSNNCENSSTVNITVEDAPESGTANTPEEFCVAEITIGQTYDLFDLLIGADQTGTWNDDDASGALSMNTVTLDGLAPGTYNFTYDVDAFGSCDDVDVTVAIIINDTPAPTAAVSQEFCDTATVADLIATGSTIQWYDAATGGNLLANTADLVDAQIYYATETDATTGCESSVRTAITATIYVSPNAGNPNNTAIVVCNDASDVDLFNGLDGTQDTGGTWQNDDGIGVLTGNSLDATGVSAGTYQFTYAVTASTPCVDDSTEIMVTIEEPLSAGADSTLDVCSNNGTTDLFTLLGSADTGGTWAPTLDSGTGLFDPLVDVDGTYTYTIANSCGTVSSEVIVTVTLAPDAGTDNSLSICMGDDTTDLFELLGDTAQSGGVWFPNLDSGSGVFDPAVDAAGLYTYTVTALSPCTQDTSAEITVTVNDTPAVIVLDSEPQYCQVNNPTVADLSISIRPSGTVNWYEDLALTLPLTDSDNLVNGEDYYATQTNSTGCESSVPVQINVTINDNPTPTLKDTSMEYCINDDPTIHDLSLNIAEHDLATNNVIWYDSATGGSAISESETLSDMTYYVALYDASTGCESSVRLEVTPNMTACGKLILPDGFSPNGDGVNDTYDIDNLGLLHPNFGIEIYNRYGNLVYKGQANSPRFDGTSNQSGTITKGDLPVGVYFYVFNFNDGENKPEQGRLYLSR